MNAEERAIYITELVSEGYSRAEIADILGEDWVTPYRCPYCEEGWLCLWQWWYECSKCNGVTLDACAL